MTVKDFEQKAKSHAETIADVRAFRRLMHSKGDLRKGLENARLDLAPRAIPQIVRELIDTSIYRQTMVRAPFPKTYAELKHTRPLPPAKDEVEAMWASGILEFHQDILVRFVEMRDAFYAQIASGKYLSANRSLDQIEAEFGVSLWLISNRITLLQLKAGTATQKSYLRTIIDSTGVSPIVGYLAYLFSFTAEDNVSLAEVTREWSRQETTRLSANTIQYIRYHISAFDFSRVDEPWQCVAHEENSAIVDRFETFIEMSALAFVRAETADSVSYLQSALGALNEIPDCRIQNTLALMRQAPLRPTSLRALSSAADILIGTDDAINVPTLMTLWTENQLQAALHEDVARFTLRTNTPFDDVPVSDIALLLVEKFRSTIGLLPTFYESRFALQKLVLVLKKVPLSRAIVAFLDGEDDDLIAATSTESEALWAISSPLGDPAQFPILKQLDGETADSICRELSAHSIASAVTYAALFPAPHSEEFLKRAGISPSFKMQFLGHLAFNRGDFQQAEAHYRQFKGSVTGHEAKRATRLMYEAARARDDLEQALSIYTDAYLDDAFVHVVFPLEKIVQWAIESGGVDSTALNRSIALYSYSLHVSTDRDGDLSDAFEDALDFCAVHKPSELISKITTDPANRTRWIYFLRYVASIRTLEDGIRFNNYGEIEGERIAILDGLIAECPALASELVDEIVKLTREREVTQLAERFDRSRIYANEVGIKQFIEVELTDAFTRYKRLAEMPTLEQEFVGLEFLLKTILKQSGEDFRGMKLPATAQEGLLAAIHDMVMDSFVLNPDHGLKTYLTTRISHGSLEGELRSAFARHYMLFPSDADVEFDSHWKPLLKISNADYSVVRAAAMKFSRRVSELILELKDQKIRIRSSPTPNGLFDFEPSKDEVDQLRIDVGNSATADGVASKVIEQLWTKVDKALVAVRREIEADFRRRVLLASDALRAAFSGVSGGAGINVLNDELTQSLTEFQASVEKVLSWFQRLRSEPVKPFSVETAVEVAAKLTNSRFPTRTISPAIDCGGSTMVRGSAFLALLDVLLNCFQNAVEHAGFGSRGPQINVSCTELGDSYSFKISNELSANCDLSALGQKISARRSVRDDRVVGARGSGLPEIERILLQEGAAGSELCIEVGPEHICTLTFSFRKENERGNSCH